MNTPQAKILVVDDEEKNVKLLEAQLRPRGYEVVTAANGEVDPEQELAKMKQVAGHNSPEPFGHRRRRGYRRAGSPGFGCRTAGFDRHRATDAQAD